MRMFNFGWRKNAGLIHIHLKRDRFWLSTKHTGTDIDLHLFVKPKHWMLGHSWEEYDLSVEYYGAGPLFLLCLS